MVIDNNTIIEATKRIIVHYYNDAVKDFEKTFGLKVTDVIEMAKENIEMRNHPLHAFEELKIFYNL